MQINRAKIKHTTPSDIKGMFTSITNILFLSGRIRKVRLEPTRPKGQDVLSVPRLPIPPQPRHLFLGLQQRLLTNKFKLCVAPMKAKYTIIIPSGNLPHIIITISNIIAANMSLAYVIKSTCFILISLSRSIILPFSIVI